MKRTRLKKEIIFLKRKAGRKKITIFESSKRAKKFF
jgi:hypothetical protein